MINKVRRYKLKLNSIDKIEELLQELYNEACKNIEEIQTQINKITSSVELNNEPMDGKTKFAKAMNDFITNKDKAIGRKLEIAKLMSEIYKHNGDVEKTLNDEQSMSNMDIDSIKAMLAEEEKSSDGPKQYKLR